jgi:hypothetical protein
MVLALLLVAWIQYARPRLLGRPRGWRYTFLAAAACVAAAALLLASDLPSRFRTLNESFLAAAFVLPYLQVPRPLRRGVAGVLAGIVVVGTVAFHRSGPVTDLAETLGVLALVPIAFDVIDKGILDPAATTSRVRRLVWYCLLAAAPVCLSILQYQVGVPGPAGEAVRYLVRITEAFVCLLIVQLLFAVVLARTGREPVARSGRAPADHAAVTAAPVGVDHHLE